MAVSLNSRGDYYRGPANHRRGLGKSKCVADGWDHCRRGPGVWSKVSPVTLEVLICRWEGQGHRGRRSRSNLGKHLGCVVSQPRSCKIVPRGSRSKVKVKLQVETSGCRAWVWDLGNITLNLKVKVQGQGQLAIWPKKTGALQGWMGGRNQVH